ncbi:unnamed protein product [Fusarium graminearum]|uniref:Chromosome 3, complete genome n=1 Tax=Gibberella zeae (strain ATCC MYA-4620 / CBS 123657 / FGSC 9075 / NRRL 31084 / PH-1) TaxID=229533 RepID=A0A098E1F2_GIBZE|nr:unnamed protein product [Fusarium graminearum]CZS85076.1 unnamed protein product [Fusarium graminearum]
MDGASVGLQCFFFLLALLLACLEEMELEKQGLGGTVRSQLELTTKIRRVWQLELRLLSVAWMS